LRLTEIVARISIVIQSFFNEGGRVRAGRGWRILFVALLISACFFISASSAFANGLSFSNIKVNGWNTTANTCQVQFDITWSNAWRDAVNWDAAWVFIKFSTDNGSTWSHVTLAPSGHKTTVGQEAEIVLPTEPVSGYKGVFIQFPATTASHTFTATGVKLVWDYGKDGVSDAQIIDAANTSVKVFGIEMVYIPSGSFYIGDGVAGTESTYAFHENGVDNTAVLISTTSKNITCDSNANDDIDTTPVAVQGDIGLPGINSSWPTGYNAFYLMKYEISQGQMRDFLNQLTRTQQNQLIPDFNSDDWTLRACNCFTSRSAIRNPTSIPGGAITVGCDFDQNKTFNQTTDGEWIACNFLTWPRISAYADWAALRPATEMEFEKAGRGPNSAVAGEYAWGTTNLTQATSISNSGAVSEVAGNSGNGLSVEGSNLSVQGPLRVGFAATGSTTREQAGAGYYGNMELSGNLTEYIVTIGNSSGRAFLGTHGDGVLSAQGYATNSDWPGYVSGQVTGSAGCGHRGGDYSNSSSNCRISDRLSATSAGGGAYYGGRCARTAPS